ncbi:hypothetical protein LTR97_000597 [Elasticomyces elasticus]|uniref:Uncharacterized protein n=1 Tax=Elasticomyces elasticus TaxID=574655 RepID=A0AAN7WEY7_9PEZI|nr:hypothetical protein LTR97_000597 [Elasticomyces elasticus]
MVDNSTFGNGLTDISVILRALGQRPSSANSWDTTTRKDNVEFSTRFSNAYIPENDVIFLAVSVGVAYGKKAQSYEPLPKCAVAVGCARLDARKINGLAPGTGGCEWVKEITSQVRVIAGRQDKDRAWAVTRGCGPSDLEEFTKSQIIAWLRNGETTGSNHERRKVIVLYDTYESPQDSLKASLKVLEDEFGSFESRQYVVKVIDVVKLHNGTKSAQEPIAPDFERACAAHGFSLQGERRAKDRAENVLLTTLAIALEAAADQEPGLSAVQPVNVVCPRSNTLRGTTEAADSPSIRKANIARPLTQPETSRTDCAITHDRTTNISGFRIPVFCLHPKDGIPTTRPVEFDSAEHLIPDRRTIRIYATGPRPLPDFITHLRKLYTWKTRTIVPWLVEVAHLLGYEHLHSKIEEVTEWGVTRSKIKTNVDHIHIGRFIASWIPVPELVIATIRETVEERTFSSDWYDNLMVCNDALGVWEPLPSDHEIVVETGKHRAFAKMMEELADILQGGRKLRRVVE